MQLNGTLSAQRTDATRILSLKSEVQRGDTLITQRDSFAQVQFTDGSTATLRPNTTLRIDDYQFDQKVPGKDGIVMNLVKGGLRTVTGLIGKRGNQDAYKIQTSTATIGIRGSEGETFACTAGCDGTTSKSGGLPPGVYHVTNSDMYIMVTNQGSVLIGPGQFGFSNDINKPRCCWAAIPASGCRGFRFRWVPRDRCRNVLRDKGFCTLSGSNSAPKNPRATAGFFYARPSGVTLGIVRAYVL